MHIEEAQLESFIFDSGLISKRDFEAAKKTALETEQSIEHILLNRGLIGSDDLRRIHAYLLGVPFVDLKRERLDLATLSLIPEPISRNHNVVALKKEEEGIEVVLLHMDDLEALNFLSEKTGKKILPRLTDEESIKQALLSYQKLLKNQFGEFVQRGASTQSGIAIVDALFGHALLQGVSDLHIEPQENQVLVRYRVSGRLYDAMVLPPKTALATLVRIKSLAGLPLEELESVGEGHFVLETDKEKVFIKVSLIPTLYGEKIVLHLARENAKGFTLESLGFQGENLEALHFALKHPSGSILVTGPRSSGKTTTLYTFLDLLNAPSRNISTIEDSIEYRIPRVNQTQVREEKGVTLLTGLRAILRQDPDVIMVSELKETEEITFALQASSPRALVLGSVEGRTGATLLSRLIERKIDPLLISSHLKLIVAERLVKKLGDKKAKYHLSKKDLDHLGKFVDLERMLKILKQEKIIGAKDTWEKVSFYRLEKDGDFVGQLGLQEVLKITPTIQNLIENKGTAADFELQAKKEGMLTLLEDGILKAARGLTTIDEVLRAVSE